MPKIVRYRNKAALRYAPYAVKSHPYYKYASAAARVYNTGKAFAPYARKAINMWNSRKRGRGAQKRKFKRSIGERVGSGPAKRNRLAATGLNSLTYGTLFSRAVIDIPKTTAEAIDKRSRDIVNYRGFKVCFYVRNNNDIGRPCWFNWAIISPKSADPSVTTIPNTDFFRDNGSGSTRSKDFNGVTVPFLELHCLPINTDKYLVHSHKRMRISGIWNGSGVSQPYGDAASNLGMAGTALIERYIPINRQVRFDGTTSTPNTQVYMVWWATNETNSTGVEGTYSYTITQYFKEPKNG